MRDNVAARSNLETLLISYKVDEHGGGLDVIETENKGTATSASLYRMQNIMDAQDAVQVGSSICVCLLIFISF